MQLHPNLEIRKVIPKVKKLGCNVENKHRHGEIVFTHPLIDIPYVISNNKDGIGKGFLSWLKPVIQEKKEKLLDPTKLEYKIGFVVWYTTKKHNSTTTVHDIIEFYKLESSKNQHDISCGLSLLNRKGFIKRIRRGEYKACEELNIFFDGQETQQLDSLENNPKIQENKHETQQLDSLENNPKIQENKQETQQLDFLEKENSMLRQHVELLTDRFETCLNKIEKLTERLEETEEVKDAVKIMEDIFQKRCLTR